MIVWFSRERPFLDPEVEAWQIDTWRWLRGHRVGLKAPLVLPNREFFPPTDEKGHARVQHVLDCVKQHAGMADWPCELVEQDPSPPSDLGGLAYVKHGPHAAGTYRPVGNAACITYDPTMTDQPVKLVATLAHELAHYRLDALPDDPPGGEDASEFATDLCTVAMGFGLFGASCAFNFSQFHESGRQGWQTSTLGYLGEREWAFALAIWLELEGHSNDEVRDVLKPSLFTDIKTARKSIVARGITGQISPVTSIEPNQ